MCRHVCPRMRQAPLPPSTTHVRFTGVVGGGYTGDMCLDKVVVVSSGGDGDGGAQAGARPEHNPRPALCRAYS